MRYEIVFKWAANSEIGLNVGSANNFLSRFRIDTKGYENKKVEAEEEVKKEEVE
jgi:hypothetical protein